MFDAHYLTNNIIIGKAELFYIPHKEGWITPGGFIIKDKIEAIKFACDLNDFIVQQYNYRQQKTI